MHQRVLKLMFAPIFALVLTLGFALPSFAANTWRPTFNASQHVYLDPALQSGNNSVNLDGLESQLVTEGKKHGVEFFFVMALKGDETTPGNQFSQTRLDEIMGNWAGARGFPADRAVVLYVVRLNSDWTKSAVADNIATQLQQQGVDRPSAFGIADSLSQHRTANPRALLPLNPRGFAISFAQGIDQLIDNHTAQVAAEQQAEKDRQAEAARQAEQDRINAIAHAKTMHTVMTAIEFGGPILILLIVCGVFYSRKRKAVAAAATEIARWDGLFQTANANYIELDSHYLDFLKRQGDNWKDKFKGITLTRYTAAISAYADLSVRIKTAANLIAAAKKANDSGNIFSTAGNLHALAMLTTDDVTIDSKALPFEQQGLFGALLDGKSNTKKPNELLEDMDSLFQTTNKTMADIMAAFEGSAKNKGEIETQFAAVEALKSALSEANLSFDAYAPGFAALAKAKDAFLAIVDSDPLEAFEESKQVESECEELTAKIGHAIDLRKSLSTTDDAIKAAAARIAEVRGKSADYTYPDGGSAAAGAAANYTLTEVGSNPDDDLNAAKESLTSSISLVVAGKLDESKAAKAQAEAEAQAAIDTVAKVLAAHDLVQKQVPVVHGALDKLVAEIPGGDEALAALNAGFLPKNFSNAPGQLSRAKAVKDATSGQLAAVKAAFFEQRFVAAAAQVTSVTGDIQGSRDGIIAIHTRLQELTDLRAHAKSQTEANTRTEGGLTSKIAQFAFTTSAQTDGELRSLTPMLANQQADVAKAVTDWPAAAAAADQLASDLKGVDEAIDSEKAAYDHAVGKLGELRAAVSSAASVAGNNVVRSQAHSLLSQAQQVLGQAEAAITQPKSDWNSLSQRFETNIATAHSAQSAAEADIQAYNDAVAAIRSADSYVRGVEDASYTESRSGIGHYSGTFGMGVSANCSTAHSYINSAESLLQSGRYEDAEREAGHARSAADDAKRQAEEETERLIAIAVAAWQAEEAERMRREQEERDRQEAIRRQQQEDDDRRRREEESRNSSNNGSFGGGFSGGGGSDGGGFSGGGGGSDGGGFS